MVAGAAVLEVLQNEHARSPPGSALESGPPQHSQRPSRKRSHLKCGHASHSAQHKKPANIQVVDLDKVAARFASCLESARADLNGAQAYAKKLEDARASRSKLPPTETLQRRLRGAKQAVEELGTLEHQLLEHFKEVQDSFQEDAKARVEESLQAFTNLKLQARLTDLQLGKVIKTVRDSFGVRAVGTLSQVTKNVRQLRRSIAKNNKLFLIDQEKVVADPRTGLW